MSEKHRKLQKKEGKLSFLLFIKEWEDFMPNCTLDGERKQRNKSQVFGNCKSWWKCAFYFGLQCCSLVCCYCCFRCNNTLRYLSFSFFLAFLFFLFLFSLSNTSGHFPRSGTWKQLYTWQYRVHDSVSQGYFPDKKLRIYFIPYLIKKMYIMTKRDHGLLIMT